MGLTLLDWALVVIALGSVWSAGERGLGRETLHTILYGLLMGAGLWFMNSFPPPDSARATGEVLINFGYYALVAYIFTWAIARFGAPLLIDGDPPSVKSRFWAMVLALAKLAVSVLGLNLWLAMHSPDAHPLRLEVLPVLVQESVIIQASDAETDQIYQWLAAKNVVTYRKYTYRKESGDSVENHSFEDVLRGVSGTSR